MKLTKSLVMAVAAMALLASPVQAGYPELPLNLGGAGQYAVLAKSGISTVPPSIIVGNLGVSPAAATYITGFGLVLAGPGTFSTSPQVAGRIFAASYAYPTPALLTTEIGDMETAYAAAAGRTLPDKTELGSGSIGGLTLTPGLYKWSTGVMINSDVTLAGNASDVWIFQIEGNLTMASATSVHLSGGAQARNVFWQVAGGAGAVIGTTAHFEGNLLTAKKIDLQTGASVNGRLLAQTAVTLSQNAVNEPVSAVANDFDGDRISDLTVFHPPTGTWRGLSSGGGTWTRSFGWSTTVPVPADYDGDGVTDVAVYHPATGKWYIRPSGGGATREVSFGWSATVPLPGDYDGDGQADLAVFHPADGKWSFLCSEAGRYSAHWGWSTTIPVPADYDGDGVTDIAVFHPDSGIWYIYESSKGLARQVQWGWGNALPVPADYNGDGRADVAVFHRASGTWRISYSGGGSLTKLFGWSSTIPVAADYDGDGAADLAVYHPATGNWHILKSTTGGIVVRQWGWSAAIPTLLYPMIHSWFGLP